MLRPPKQINFCITTTWKRKYVMMKLCQRMEHVEAVEEHGGCGDGDMVES